MLIYTFFVCVYHEFAVANIWFQYFSIEAVAGRLQRDSRESRMQQCILKCLNRSLLFRTIDVEMKSEFRMRTISFASIFRKTNCLLFNSFDRIFRMNTVCLLLELLHCAAVPKYVVRLRSDRVF